MSLFELKKNHTSSRITKQKFIDDMFEFHQVLFEYSRFIKDGDVLKIEILDNGVFITSKSLGIKIFCDTNDKRNPAIESLNFGNYEGGGSDMIFRLIKNGDTVLDIGANVGWYSLGIAKLFKGLD